ncbi:MAG: (d)CMP kinase [Vulcanimicrobiaceae bacterium]
MRRERSALGMTRLAHVAIDGPAGSGKTTVAHALARRLGILYLDTGAMYRAVALAALRAHVDPADRAAVAALARAEPIHAEVDPAVPLGFRIFAGTAELGDELYANDVSRIVSIVAAQPEIRAYLVERQRDIAAQRPVIMAGRDIGTVVLPDAPFKIFLTASVDERVERRLAELVARGTTVDRATLHGEIVARDRLDEERPLSPLRPAGDAIQIDSTGLPVDVVVERIAAIVRG